MKMKLRPPVDYRQLRGARAILGLGVHEVAALAGMGNSTIVKLEKPEGVASANASTVNALEAFYQARGVKFNWNTTGRGVLWDEARLAGATRVEMER